MSTCTHQHDLTPDKSQLKPIRLCADDFGMSPEVNAGIIELASQGCLSAASCMSRGQAFAADAQQLAELPIETGLHLNLTEALGSSGFTRPLPHLILNCFTRSIDANRISKEISDQLDLFERVMGKSPDYVDGHQHVHQLPIVRDRLIGILLARYGKKLPWLRSTLPGTRNTPLPKARIIGWLGGKAMQSLARQRGFKMNASLLGVYELAGGAQRYRTLLDTWIDAATPDDLIMCHPARGQDKADPLNPQRCAEFAVLSGTDLAESLEQHRSKIATRRPVGLPN